MVNPTVLSANFTNFSLLQLRNAPTPMRLTFLPMVIPVDRSSPEHAVADFDNRFRQCVIAFAVGRIVDDLGYRFVEQHAVDGGIVLVRLMHLNALDLLTEHAGDLKFGNLRTQLHVRHVEERLCGGGGRNASECVGCKVNGVLSVLARGNPLELTITFVSLEV